MSDTAGRRYVIRRSLGKGGMGEVFLAYDEYLQRPVALKFLSDVSPDRNALDRVLHEARAAAAIDHPFVCKIYEVGEEDGRAYIAMEYVEGQTLHTLMASGHLPLPRALRIAHEIAGALARAHASGVIHRDLKPANIMLTADGHVKVMDFGLATRTLPFDAQTASHAALAGSAQVVGTLEYMAPEQLRGEAVDGRADIFAFGVIVHQMIEGAHPFAKPTPIETAAAILSGPLPTLGGRLSMATPLGRLVQRMLARDRGERWSSIDEVRNALTALVEQPERALAPSRALPRRRLAIGALVAAAVLAIAIAAWSVAGRRTGDGAANIGSLVAMPAAVSGGDADAFLAEAVPNALSNALVGVDGMEIKRPPTSHELERAGADVDRLASLYGVEAYVTSTVAATGDSLVLDVQLTDARRRTLLWSGRFNGERQRYLDLVHDAADAVRAALRPRQQPLARAAGAAANEVELLLQRGYYLSNVYKTRGRQPDFERAKEALEQAAALDPGRADVATALALLYNTTELTGARTPAILAEAERWARRAISIDGRSSSAWALLGEIERVKGDGSYARRMDFALKGATFGPRDAYAHSRLSGALAVNSYVLALAAAEESTRIDPLHLDGAIYEAVAHAALSDTGRALARVDYALSIEPDSLFALLSKMTILSKAGRLADVQHLIEQLQPMAAAGRIHPSWIAVHEEALAWHRAVQRGDPVEIRKVAERLASLGRGEKPFPRWEFLTQGFARWFELQGLREMALDLYAYRSEHGIVEAYDSMVLHDEHARLKADPRFKATLDLSQRRFDEMAAILEFAAGRGEVPAYLTRALTDLKARLAKANAAP